MASKAELLDELTLSELKELASEREVELQSSRKAEVVDELASSRGITKAAIQEKLDAKAESEGDEDEDTSNEPEPGDFDSETGETGLPDSVGNAGGSQKPTADAEGNEVPASGGPVGLTPANVKAGPLAAREQNVRPLDRALIDPEGIAQEKFEGRTSDAKTRNADGPQIDEVPPDLNESAKPSDGGPERYPFPQGGDVDVLTVDAGNGDREHLAPLEVDDWVVLGEHDSVPDRLVGKYAAVVDAPRILCNCDWAPRTHEHTSPDGGITVRVRDETDATLVVPLEAIDFVGKGGRAAVLPIG